MSGCRSCWPSPGAGAGQGDPEVVAAGYNGGSGSSSEARRSSCSPTPLPPGPSIDEIQTAVTSPRCHRQDRRRPGSADRPAHGRGAVGQRSSLPTYRTRDAARSTRSATASPTSRSVTVILVPQAELRYLPLPRRWTCATPTPSSSCPTTTAAVAGAAHVRPRLREADPDDPAET